MNRYLDRYIQADLPEKMVFIGGPRQVGKTTLSFQILGSDSLTHPAYLSWDVPQQRRDLIDGILPVGEELIILDEIHKYSDWRSLVKGFYDTYRGSKRFLITGSARLDYYRRGGDSLQGRYHYYRLHPFTIEELGLSASGDIETLLRFGGFPEPFIKGSTRHWKRWQKERHFRLIQEDLVSLERVREVGQLDLLASILPERVGSMLSVKALSEELKVAFETTESWLQILENLYHCFRILPYGPSKVRALKKDRKLYMWDWSLCLTEGSVFENLVASHLLKYCHLHEDVNGDTMELRFLRDYDGREVDFVVLREGAPLFAVECKTRSPHLSKHIPYFAQRTDIPIFYQVHLGEKDYEMPAVRSRVLPLVEFCKLLSPPEISDEL